VRKLALAWAVLGMAVWVSAGSVEDAARREQERRKKLVEAQGKQSHVIDAEIVRTATPPDPRARPVATEAPEATPAESEAEPELDDSARRKKDEARWRQRVAAAKERIEYAQKQVDWAEKLWLGFGDTIVDTKGKVIAESPADVEKLRVQARAELAASHANLERVLEEGRRAGVPAGWLD